MLHELLASRGVTLSTLGAAYLFLLANVIGAAVCYALARKYLVISPNRATKDYGLYVVVMLLTLIIATILENELTAGRANTLQYAAIPQIVMLLIVHLWIYRRQEPWLVALGAASVVAAVVVVLAATLATNQVRYAHWAAVIGLGCLLTVLWLRSVTTKRAFMTAKSIYIDSKERAESAVIVQKPWLGMAQWVGLAAASLLLAAANAVMQGSSLVQVPAMQVLFGSVELIGATSLIVAIPAASYWITHKNWMPELTRFVWLVWLVVGFAFSYSTFLTHLGSA